MIAQLQRLDRLRGHPGRRKPKLGNRLGDVLAKYPATRRATPPCSALESPAVVGVGPTVSGWVSICSPNRSTRELPSPPATARLTRLAAARARTANSAALIEVCSGATGSSRSGAASRPITAR